MAAHPEIRAREAAIEAHTKRYLQNVTSLGAKEAPGALGPLIVIPVVVHIIYNTADQNLSDAIVQSQIDELNAGFRKLNPDVGLVPAAFAPLVADVRVQFCLATRAPNGNPTNGITRLASSVAAWGTNQNLKFAANGGTDAWNTTQYLNICCARLGGGTLGYAYLPGVAPTAQYDGIVLDYQTVGRNNATSLFNYRLGRVALHEVGHWLNLKHIWGANSAADISCSDSDDVADTPNQEDVTFGCPSFPQLSCGNGLNGDMFMNHMDYVNDDCKLMFSTGQAQRMQAIIAPGGYRAALQNSPGLNPVIGFSSTAPTTLLCGDQTDYNFRVIPISVGCSGGSIQYQWTATNGWAVTNPNGFSPQIIPNGTSGSTITLTGTYYNGRGGVFPLNTTSLTIGFSGQVQARPLFLYGGGGVTCPSVTETFGVAPVGGASGYRWTLPAGFTTPAGPLNAAGQIITAGPSIGIIANAGIIGGIYALQCQSVFSTGCPFSALATRSFQFNGVGSSYIADVDPTQRNAQGVVCRKNNLALRLVSPGLIGTPNNIVWRITGAAGLPLPASAQGALQITFATPPVGGAFIALEAKFTDACGAEKIVTYAATTQTAPDPNFPYLGPNQTYDCRINEWQRAAPYPNPTTVSLRLPGYRGEVVVYNQQGQPIHTFLAPGTPYGAEVNTSAWPEGLYVVTGRDLSGAFVRYNVQVQH